jgi:hypothetical protein
VGEVAIGGALVMCTLFGAGDDVTCCVVVFCAKESDFCNYKCSFIIMSV